MSVTVSEDNNGIVTISIGKEFNFDTHRGFRDAYRNRPKGTNYIINLSKTIFMDSSALGMLLLFREFNGENKIAKIINCGKDIYKIFEIANFNKLFDIE